MADAHGSGPCEVTLMRVQVPFSAVEIKMPEYKLRHLFYSSIYHRGRFSPARTVPGGIKKAPFPGAFPVSLFQKLLSYDISENTV